MIDSHTNLTNLTKSTCYARACHPAAISSKLHSFMPINRQPSQPTLISRRRQSRQLRDFSDAAFVRFVRFVRFV